MDEMDMYVPTEITYYIWLGLMTQRTPHSKSRVSIMKKDHIY